MAPETFPGDCTEGRRTLCRSQRASLSLSLSLGCPGTAGTAKAAVPSTEQNPGHSSGLPKARLEAVRASPQLAPENLTTQWFGCEGTLRLIPFQPCQAGLCQAAPGLGTARDRGSHSCQGTPRL